MSMAATALAVMLQASPMVKIPEGDYVPFFQQSPGKGNARIAPGPTRVAAFRLDAFPVTNAQFLDFVREHPEWRRSQVKPLFADSRYLARRSGIA
jgi:sulfatase modifying factor 1